jgi:hypothetical protein
MSDDPSYRQNFDEAGAYLPYTAPLPVPTSEIDSEPLSSICINDDWVPYLLGAAKQLARYEIWQGSKEDMAFAVGEASMIPELVTDGCGTSTPVPNWYWNVVTGSGYWRVMWNFDDSDPWDVFVAGINGFGDSNPGFGFEGLVLGTFDQPCGGPITANFETIDTLDHIWTYTFTDCPGGTPIGDTVVTNHVGFFEDQLYSLEIQCSHPFMGQLHINGNYTCTVA